MLKPLRNGPAYGLKSMLIDFMVLYRIEQLLVTKCLEPLMQREKRHLQRNKTPYQRGSRPTSPRDRPRQCPPQTQAGTVAPSDRVGGAATAYPVTGFIETGQPEYPVMRAQASTSAPSGAEGVAPTTECLTGPPGTLTMGPPEVEQALRRPAESPLARTPQAQLRTPSRILGSARMSTASRCNRHRHHRSRVGHARATTAARLATSPLVLADRQRRNELRRLAAVRHVTQRFNRMMAMQRQAMDTSRLI